MYDLAIQLNPDNKKLYFKKGIISSIFIKVKHLKDYKNMKKLY